MDKGVATRVLSGWGMYCMMIAGLYGSTLGIDGCRGPAFFRAAPSFSPKRDRWIQTYNST